MTSNNPHPTRPDANDPEPPAEQPTTTLVTDGGSDDNDDADTGADTNDGRLTAAKRNALRYGVKSQNAAEDNPTLRRFTMILVVAVLASVVFVNPVAAQCDEGVGLFISDMQEMLGSIVLGFIVLIALIALALILLPVAGTAAIGWTMIFAVGGALILYMLAFWLFGIVGDYGVLGMDEACSPFY